MIKKGDFVELDYIGRLKDDKIVFDTTIEQVAKDADIYNSKFDYKPTVICVGEAHLIKGLDDFLMGKNPDKYTVEVKPEDGFGKKSTDLLKLLPLKLFKKEQVQPYPGLEVTVDDNTGVIKTVSGGRVIVDFNHPLSGKDLVYDIDIKRIVTDPLEKVRALLELIRMPFQDIDIVEENATIHMKTKLPDDMSKEIGEHIMKLTGLKSVEFKEAKKAEKPAEEKKQE